MLAYAVVEKLIAVHNEDPLVLSLYMEMPEHLPISHGDRPAA